MEIDFLKRTRESRTLLNPAFCGEILRNTIKEYENHDPKGLPFTLVFFILPIILHHNSFKKIRYSTQGQFFSWLDNQVAQTIDFENRTIFLKKITLETISFLSFFNAIEIKEGRLKTINFDLSINSKHYSPYMKRYHEIAIQIGRWLSENDSIPTVYMMLGVLP
jgi:hypothetical protein